MDGSQDRRLIHGLRSQALSAAASALARAWLMSERARATSGRGRTGNGRSERPERCLAGAAKLTAPGSLQQSSQCESREGAKDGRRGSPQAGRDGRFGDGRRVRGKRRRSSGRPRSGIRVLAGLFAGLVWSEIRTRAADDTRVGYSSDSRGLDRVYKDHRRLHSSFSPSPSTNDERARLRGQTSTN